MDTGKTLLISASVSPDNAANKSVVWAISSGSTYASIDANGLLTARKAGSVTVRATAKDGSGVTGTLTITVREAALWSGSGTKTDPYLIENKTDLTNIAKVLNKSGYYFRQTADIDLAGEVWTPLGSESQPFRHHYDGAGHTVSGLTFADDENVYCYGLFGQAEGSAFAGLRVVVSSSEELRGLVGALLGRGSRVTVENCSADGTLVGGFTTGLLIGEVDAEEGKVCTLSGCSASGSVSGAAATGGLVGSVSGGWTWDDDYVYTVNFTDCTAAVEVTSRGNEVGGLIGSLDAGNVIRCRATGNVTSYGRFCGGLIGYADHGGEIAYCSAAGDVACAGHSDTAYGLSQVGGLIGSMFSRTAVHDCFASGAVSSVDYASSCQDHETYDGGMFVNYYNPAGALIGCVRVMEKKLVLYNCLATGTVTNPNAWESDLISCRGSLVGLIYDVYTVKKIDAEHKKPSGRYFDSNYEIDITEEMLTESMVGRLENNYCLGELRPTYTPINYIVRKSRTDGSLRGQYSSLPVYTVTTNLTEPELRAKATFDGFDFVNVWRMTESGPVLQ